MRAATSAATHDSGNGWVVEFSFWPIGHPPLKREGFQICPVRVQGGCIWFPSPCGEGLGEGVEAIMAARQSRKSAQKTPPVTARADTSSDSGETLSPDELARALRAMATELERDPALARRVAGAMRAPVVATPPEATNVASDATGEEPLQPARRGGKAFKPRLVTGAAPALGIGIPDPFALREQLGEEGLCVALADLRLGTLRAIVREHKLDPSGKLAGQNDEAKYRALILRATKRAKRA